MNMMFQCGRHVCWWWDVGKGEKVYLLSINPVNWMRELWLLWRMVVKKFLPLIYKWPSKKMETEIWRIPAGPFFRKKRCRGFFLHGFAHRKEVQTEVSRIYLQFFILWPSSITTNFFCVSSTTWNWSQKIAMWSSYNFLPHKAASSRRQNIVLVLAFLLIMHVC